MDVEISRKGGILKSSQAVRKHQISLETRLFEKWETE